MYNLKKYVKRQKKAFAKGDITEARRLLTKFEKALKKQQAWYYLRSNEIVSYKQLYRKLRYMSESLSSSGKSVMTQLIRIFQWCEEHHISLAYLDVSANLHKYREATAHLIGIIAQDATIAKIKADLFEAINRLKADMDRDVTRSWTRKKRAES